VQGGDGLFYKGDWGYHPLVVSLDAVLDFFDRVNAAAVLQSGGVGPFAWRAIYNPRAVREAVDAKLGELRLLFHPGHTDHIHIDVRPVEL
jgi:hypothetical protein